MEIKVILYIIIGIVYFIVTAAKKVQEQKKPLPATEGKKPVSPPTGNPMEDVLRELKKQQAEKELKRKAEQQRRQTTTVQPTFVKGKDIFIKEEKKPAFVEGKTDYGSNYTDEVTARLKAPRVGVAPLANEGIYKIETVEEAEAREEAEDNPAPYELNPRQAFIGSIIFERKF